MTEEDFIAYYEDNSVKAFLCREQKDYDQAADIETLNIWVARDLRRYAFEIRTIDTPGGQSLQITDLR